MTEPTVLPTPLTKAKFTEFPLAEFYFSRAMWAANYFVLWPLGLALTVDVDTVATDPEHWCGKARFHEAHTPSVMDGASSGDSECAGVQIGDEVTGLRVSHWEYPEGEGSETINQEAGENSEDFKTFAGFVFDKVMDMKSEERMIAIRKLATCQIIAPEQILVGAVDE